MSSWDVNNRQSCEIRTDMKGRLNLSTAIEIRAAVETKSKNCLDYLFVCRIELIGLLFSQCNTVRNSIMSKIVVTNPGELMYVYRLYDRKWMEPPQCHWFLWNTNGKMSNWHNSSLGFWSQKWPYLHDWVKLSVRLTDCRHSMLPHS